MDKIYQFLAREGFCLYDDLASSHLNAKIFSITGWCGIYVLKFANSEYYVGKSVDVRRRFREHKKNYNDIVGIAFKCVDKEMLDKEEKFYISSLEAKCSLRNIEHTSMATVSNSDFSAIMPLAEQEKWLATVNCQPRFHDRVADKILREKTKQRCQRLMINIIFMNEVLPVMREYVKLCIPEPYHTELKFWGCSCLPSPTRSYVEIYSRINVNYQEILTAAYNKKTKKIILRFHVRLSDIRHNLQNLYTLAPTLREMPDYNYPYAGSDQICFELASRNDALALLENDRFQHGIKAFNLARLRSGPQPFGRFHSPALADKLLLI